MGDTCKIVKATAKAKAKVKVKAKAKAVPLELKYWSGRGRAEATRMCFAARGKYPPNDYKDQRYFKPGQAHTEDAKPWEEMDGVGANLGRVPCLLVGKEG